MRRLGVVAAYLFASFSGCAACAEPARKALGQPLAAPRLAESSARRVQPNVAPEPDDLVPLWSFHAGAPLRAPAGVGEGGIAVGSSDGYVHALRPDGAYRWSFTVKGAIVASPLVDSRGAVYVVTDWRRLYALTPAGTLGWTLPLAGVPLDPVRWSKGGELLIATRQGVAYAITRGGVVKAAAALREPLTAPPLPLPSGRWLVGGERGTVFTLDEWRVSRERPVSSPILKLVPSVTGYVGLSEEGLFLPGGALKDHAQHLGRCGPERAVVASRTGGIGEVVGSGVAWWINDFTEPLSAAPSCLGDGRALLPLASGTLGVIEPPRQVKLHPLGSSALFTPTLDEARGQLLVSSADGRVVALAPESL